MLKENLKRVSPPINLIFISESCGSIIKLPAICESLVELSKKTGIFDPVAIIFGSDDLCASLGATRTESSQEILYARQRLVLVAKAYGLQAIDMVHINYKGMFYESILLFVFLLKLYSSFVLIDRFVVTSVRMQSEKYFHSVFR